MKLLRRDQPPSLPSQLLQRFSWKRLDSRRLQHELDTHRLFLLTEHHARESTGSSANIAQITTEAERLSFEVLFHMCMHAVRKHQGNLK